MAISVKGFDGNPFDQNSIEGLAGRFITTICKLVFTGSYTTGGDTLDLSGVQPPAQSRGIVDVKVIANGPASSVSANGGEYTPITNTALASWKLKIFATAGTEYSAGAYSTDVTTDVVFLEIKWAR